jgi:hypothetical protein
MWHACGRGDVFTRFWLGGPKARDHWEDLSVGGRTTLKWTLHCVLKNPQSIFLPQSERPSFAPIQHNWQNYSFIYFNL